MSTIRKRTLPSGLVRWQVDFTDQAGKRRSKLFPRRKDADVYLAKFTNGQTVSHDLKPGRHAWIHVAEGNVRVNGQTLSGGDAVALSEESKVEIAGQGNAQVLLFDLN